VPKISGRWGPAPLGGVWLTQGNRLLPHIKVKVKVHTLDIEPLRSESPPQKRSGMTRVLKGFHSFSCTPTRSSASGMSHTCLCLHSRSWYSFTDPGGMEGPRRDGRLSRPWCEVAPAEIRTCKEKFYPSPPTFQGHLRSSEPTRIENDFSIAIHSNHGPIS